jgi:hypothetical protein
VLDLRPAAAEFAEKARGFCAFVDTASSLPMRDRLRGAREHLAELVRAAGQLPDVPPQPLNPTAHAGSPARWPGFGELDPYWEVFDPYDPQAPLQASLSDDVLDVYGDLQRGLAAYEAGRIDEAIWVWRFYFEVHWADHAVDALRALHRACVRGDPEA